MMEKKYVAQKALLVNPQGEILMLKCNAQRSEYLGGCAWDVPGGRMDAGEYPRETLKREICEEIGIEIEPAEATVFFTDLWGVQGDVAGQPVVGTFWVVHVGMIEPHLSDEHAEYEWFDPRRPTPEDFSASPLHLHDLLDAYRRHEGIAVAADEAIKGHEGFGLVQVVTGNGKGKTTSAIGQVVRAVGAGKNAAVIFFDKGGEHYMERGVLELLGVAWHAFGRDRIDPMSGRFDFSVTDEDRRLGALGIDKARALLASGRFDLLVLDEICSSVALGMVDESAVLALMDEKPSQVELILTGRNAPQTFLDRAHLVTQMRLLKHYFYSGVKAREGLDY